MKKTGALVLAILILAFSVAAAQEKGSETITNSVQKALVVTVVPQADAFTFRNGVLFGMTRSEVAACEGEPEDIDDTAYFYSDKEFAGFSVTIGYGFSDEGKLIAIVAMNADAHRSDSDYFDSFDAVDEALKKLYGDPVVDKAYRWSDTTYQDDEQQYGEAIRAEHLRVYSVWIADHVKISHILFGTIYDVINVIEFNTDLY